MGLNLDSFEDLWRIVSSAMDNLREAIQRSQMVLRGSMRGPALKQAEELMLFLLDNGVVERLCSFLGGRGLNVSEEGAKGMQ